MSERSVQRRIAFKKKETYSPFGERSEIWELDRNDDQRNQSFWSTILIHPSDDINFSEPGLFGQTGLFGAHPLPQDTLQCPLDELLPRTPIATPEHQTNAGRTPYHLTASLNPSLYTEQDIPQLSPYHGTRACIFSSPIQPTKLPKCIHEASQHSSQQTSKNSTTRREFKVSLANSYYSFVPKRTQTAPKSSPESSPGKHFVQLNSCLRRGLHEGPTRPGKRVSFTYVAKSAEQSRDPSRRKSRTRSKTITLNTLKNWKTTHPAKLQAFMKGVSIEQLREIFGMTDTWFLSQFKNAELDEIMQILKEGKFDKNRSCSELGIRTIHFSIGLKVDRKRLLKALFQVPASSILPNINQASKQKKKPIKTSRASRIRQMKNEM